MGPGFTAQQLLIPFPDDGTRVLGVSSSDIVLSTDGAQSIASLHPTRADFLLVDKVQSGRLYYGQRKSSDAGRTWRGVPYPGTSPCTYACALIGLVFARNSLLLGWTAYPEVPSVTQDILVRSIDEGASWGFGSLDFENAEDLAIIQRVTDNGRELLALIDGNDCSHGNQYRNCGGTARSAASSDDGATWTSRGAAPKGDQFGPVIQPGNGPMIAAFQKFMVPDMGSATTTPDGLYSSPDGAVWTAIPAIGLPVQFITALAAAAGSSPSRLYATIEQAALPWLFYSDDLGKSWAPAAIGLPPVEPSAVAVDPATPGTVLVATRGAGIYRSLDGGISWSRFPAGVYPPDITTLAFDPGKGGLLYATSTSGGPFTIDSSKLPSAYPVVVEYLHSASGHYFITASSDEVAALDHGDTPGWVRTGESFVADAANTLGVNPVCRFSLVGTTPVTSHFYTAYSAECAALKQNPGWQYEAVAFGLRVRGIDGTCPAMYRPIYRLYNNGIGGAPNHRYTISTAIVQTMLAAGWIEEGDASTGVFACVPDGSYPA